MPITLQPSQQMNLISNPQQTTPPLPNGAFNAQAAPAADLSPLVNAMMKIKLQNRLKGKLPGVNPQNLGAGTAGSDIATGPQALSLGGAPNMVA